jgi:hypothetical protein
MRIDNLVRRIPYFWRYADHFRPRFPGTQCYWEKRYAGGGDSGQGSAGQLAAFKAEILNEFVKEKAIHSIVEFGCGDGRQLLLADYPRYAGLDVSSIVIKKNIERFRDDPSKSFFLYTPECFNDPAAFLSGDLALSIDVLFHLVEDHVFYTYMNHLFGAGLRFVGIYSSNEEKIYPRSHERHRRFTSYIDQHFSEWRLIQRIPNRYPMTDDCSNGSFCDFYFYEKAHSDRAG